MDNYRVLKSDAVQKPLVSIICITFNHEEYLRECLDGILMQDVNFQYEIVVHDDASTDRTRDILMEYREKYADKFKFIFQQENQYSKGKHILIDCILPQLEGKYVAICEGDDFWTDNKKLQRQVDFLETHADYSACVHNSIKWNLLDGKKEIMYSCEKDYDIPFEAIAQAGGACYQTASLICRNKCFEHLPKFFSMVTTYFDYTLAMHLALEGKVRFLNDVMSTYRFFSNGSLAEKSIYELKGVRAKKYQATLDMLKEVDHYSKYAYHTALAGVMEDCEYIIAECTDDYRTLSKVPHKAKFKSNGIQYRLKIFIKYYFKGIYQIYKKIRY